MFTRKNHPRVVECWANSNLRMKLEQGRRQRRTVTIPSIADRIFKFRNKSQLISRNMAISLALAARARYQSTDLSQASNAPEHSPEPTALPLLVPQYPSKSSRVQWGLRSAGARPRQTLRFQNQTVRCAWESRGLLVTTR